MLDTLFSGLHERQTADRAEQALRYLGGQNYDLVITDISMPGLGGIEILRPNQPAPRDSRDVISGSADQDQDVALRLGAFAFFAKPFSLPGRFTPRFQERRKAILINCSP